MRLTSQQIDHINMAAREVFSAAVDVRLFGSRLDDGKRGGDIDLLVEPAQSLTAEEIVSRRQRFIAQLYQRLGEQRIDVLIAPVGLRDDRAVVEVARKEGQYLLRGIA